MKICDGHHIYLLVHGPYEGNAYEKIFESILGYEKNFKVIISTYIESQIKTSKILDKYRGNFDIREIYIKDTINPGYFNFNRQIRGVRAGLDCIDDENAFVIKLRNDQWVCIKKLVKILKKLYFSNRNNSNKILSTNCYTRQDRLYHPSDMFLCGWKKELRTYYSCSLQTQTHFNIQYNMLQRLEITKDPFYLFLISPESELFRHYLSQKKWDLKNTFEDSYKALNTYINLVNTWDIDLRWNKQRNAILPAKTIILPYSFTMAPFQGAPEEQALCYARHHFDGNKTLKDSWFIFFSRFVFSVKYNKIHRMLVKIKNKVPKPIRKVLLKTSLGKKLKSIS